jgi:Putative zinc- or iron-chelating domain
VTRRSDIDAALQAIYDRIPAIPDCQGKCWVSCGPLEMSQRERQRIRQAGVRITPPEQVRGMMSTFWCEALSGDGLCRVYAMRPLVCRLWGAVEDMPCPVGCRPVPRMLTSEEGMRLVVESMDIGGDPEGLITRGGGPDSLMAAWRADVRGMRTAHAQFMARGRRGVKLRLADVAAMAGNLPPEITRRKKLRETGGQLSGDCQNLPVSW